MAAGRIPTAELFDAEFLAALGSLRIVAKRVAPRGRHAEHRSRDRGGGLEFRDYRPYAAGDDLRTIDWNIYRRLGRLFLRVYEENEDLPLYLLPDVSESAWLESPPRAVAGLRCALALAAISLGQHDRVGVFPFAEDLRVHVRPSAGKRRLFALAEALTRLEPGGRTQFARSLQTFASLKLRAGLVVVISDFFDPAGLEAVSTALRTLRHRLLLVQLVRATDARPDVTGDVRVIDCESGAGEEISVTPAVLAGYRRAHDEFQAGLAAFARDRGAGLLRLDVEQPVLAQLAALFEGGRLAV
ncbi:MAG: DUF58 domain-containing protein [Planctomycetota bacterium]|nr:DUF58 domain-containing protein [Planctomycetota bacterium]